MSSVVQLKHHHQTNAEYLLIQLDSAQQLLIEAVGQLARTTSKIEPDRAEHSRAKLRIGETSLALSRTFNAVCEYLRPRVDAHQWRVIAALRAADAGLLMYSAAHAAEWPSERIESDWRGYCLASKAMRMRVGHLIQRERDILYPLLEHGLSRARTVSDGL